MSHRIAKILLSLLALAAAVFGAAWFALDRWLESAGGRSAVERSLGDALGFPVRLGGDFGVRLLPSIGVGGTGLLAGPAADTGGDPFLHGRAYAVELALTPLWRGEVRLESVRLDGGRLDLSRWPATDSEPATAPGGAAAWTVREILVSDVEVLGASEAPLRIATLRIEDLGPGKQAPFDLRVDGLGRLDGQLRWTPADDGIAVVAAWTGVLPGQVAIELFAGLESGSGRFAAVWRGQEAAPEPVARLSLDYARRDAGVRLDEVRAESMGQTVRGTGCIPDAPGRLLDLDLEADALDLDALSAWAEFLPEPAGEGAGPEELLRLRLRVGELRSAGVLARSVVVTLGTEPDCAGLEPPPAGR